ncbi:glycosyltransferase [Olivibacter sp. XZL3]|uniref:glycosyltransferase n=1 Tax=Olivibacter sp. XZL3 TaxID=1735116 RepID=UPI0019811A60|nr:glycosyltransferase [Olivibacter sp. XZL3]
MEKLMLKEQCIVVVGQQPWDIDIGSNCKDIALEFSKKNKVLFVNTPLDRITAIKRAKEEGVLRRQRIIRHEEEGLLKINDRLFVLYPDCLVESVNWLKPYFLFDFFNRFNNRKFAKAIAKAIADLNFTDFILFNDNEIIKCFYLQELLKPTLSVYYSRDYILGTPYWRRQGLISEPRMIKKVDLCLTNSAYLMRYCQQYNPHSYDVGQGCHLPEPVNEYPVPADMAMIKAPLIGYVGALQHSRLDTQLLLKMVTEKLHWQLVLVGPEDEHFKTSELHACKNVHFLGNKAQQELPAYVKAFDVCINPQLLNPLTVGNYPRKIDEYLAFGKKIVATTTDAMMPFKDYVYLADSPADFIRQVGKALAEPDDDAVLGARRNLAASHTWSNAVDAIYRRMEQRLSELTTRRKKK